MRGKTITTTREYDDEGRMVKETTVEVEWPEPYHDKFQWVPAYPVQPWQQPLPWWQNPVISYTSLTSNTSSPVLVN